MTQKVQDIGDPKGQKVQDIGDPIVTFCVYDTLCHILKNEGVSDGKGTQKKGYQTLPERRISKIYLH
jgi:hypothetical protein